MVWAGPRVLSAVCAEAKDSATVKAANAINALPDVSFAILVFIFLSLSFLVLLIRFQLLWIGQRRC
jgi:hypothetical protein